jgi:hypothetical protein
VRREFLWSLLIGAAAVVNILEAARTEAKIAALVCVGALIIQAISAVYWSYRWRKIADDWQHAAHYTYTRFSTIINQQDAEIAQLREPWRN